MTTRRLTPSEFTDALQMMKSHPIAGVRKAAASELAAHYRALLGMTLAK